MQISFCEWDNSALARHAAASLGRGEVQAWTATVPLDEPGLTTLTRPFSPEERQRAERLNDGVKGCVSTAMRRPLAISGSFRTCV